MTQAPRADLRLASIFRGRSPDAESPDDAALGAALRQLVEEGERAFPELDLAPDVFVRHLAARAPAGAPPPPSRAPDLFLACACATQVRGAVEAFERAHLGAVGAYLARLRPSSEFVDELRQLLREKLFVERNGSPAKIAEYDGKGALANWVRVVAMRAALNLRQRSPRGVEEAGREREDPATADPEIAYLKRRYGEAFNTAFRGAVAALDHEPRELLRLHFVDGLTLDELAARAGVHRATIARRLAAAREAVADEARRLLRAALGASDAELASLAGIIRSQIELSLPGLLQGSR